MQFLFHYAHFCDFIASSVDNFWQNHSFINSMRQKWQKLYVTLSSFYLVTEGFPPILFLELEHNMENKKPRRKFPPGMPQLFINRILNQFLLSDN